MSRAPGKCLFSAPFDFLPGETLEAYRAVMDTEFREVWTRTDLAGDPALTVWATNPGQNFVVDGPVLEMFPNLQVISTPSTGTNHIDKAACRARGIPVYCLLDHRDTLESITASPEFTFLLLLNSLRRLDVAMNEVTQGRWRHNEELMRGHELDGKRVGLVGLGRIGRRLKKWCRAFDAEVVYHDPHVDADPDIEHWPLERLFAECDAVVVCCYLTEETEGMIGADLLERMRRGAHLVNTARGEVVDEAALVSFIERRPDVGVALDVLAGEVTGTHLSSPLIDLHRAGRIVVTPHIAGATVESQSKAALGALANLKTHIAAKGDPS